MSERIEQIRRDFEAWVKSHRVRRDCAEPGAIELNMERFEGGYLSEITQTAWEAWQASRATLIIELPEYDMSLERSNGIDECREAIEAAGILTQ